MLRATGSVDALSFSLEEVRFLAGALPRIGAMGPKLALTKASVFADRTLLEREFGEHARAVAALISAQRAATGKMPAGWLTDIDAAQQATSEPVARLRAHRLQQAGVTQVHDVTCSVGTEAPAFFRIGVEWMGSDVSRPRVAMARHNLGNGVWLVAADALTPVSTADVIVADPARRVGGRRITDPAHLQPPLPALCDVYRGRELAIKCAPGIDYSDWEGLVSVVSVDGGVKEVCLYTPGLAGGVDSATASMASQRQGTVREAVVMRADGFAERCASTEANEVVVAPPGTFILEPDGAVIRAGLVRHWAARHGLWMLDPHIAFVSGEAIPPGYSGFQLVETVSLKTLKRALARHGAGSVEILVRGVNVDPDLLRAKLKLKGETPMAVVIARIGDTALAYICRAREHVPAGRSAESASGG